MSVTVYCYRDDAVKPVCSYGPLDEVDDMYHMDGMPRTLDPTSEQELEAGWCNGPNMANVNAVMVFDSLGLDIREGGNSFDAADLLARVTLARAVPPVSDDGIPAANMSGSTGATFIDCGVRTGYFGDRYAAIADVCEQAIAWGVQVVAA